MAQIGVRHNMDCIAKLSCCSKLDRDGGLVATPSAHCPNRVRTSYGRSEALRERRTVVADGLAPAATTSPALIAKRNDSTSSQVLLARVAAGEGDELVKGAGVDGYRHGWIESGADAALFIEGLARQAEDVRRVSVGDVERTVQRYGEIPAMDHEFELQDAQRKMCGQCASGELHVVGQSAAAPAGQDRFCDLPEALIGGVAVACRDFDARGGAEAGEGVDQMVGKGLHVPVGTGCGAVQVFVANRLGGVVRHDQRLFGTGELVHGLS